jgi:hypothetical protein
MSFNILADGLAQNGDFVNVSGVCSMPWNSTRMPLRDAPVAALKLAFDLV